MKKLLILFFTSGLFLSGCKSGNTENMNDIKNTYGSNYEVKNIDNSIFLIEYDDIIIAMENNKKIGIVTSIEETADGTQLYFEDGNSFWIEK